MLRSRGVALLLALLVLEFASASPQRPSDAARAPAPTFVFEQGPPVFDPELDAPFIQTSVVDIDGDGDDEVIVGELNWEDPDRPWANNNVFVPDPVWIFDYVGGRLREIGRKKLPKSLRMTWIQDMGRVADFNQDGVVDVFIGESGWDCCRHPFPGGPSALLLGRKSGSYKNGRTPGDKNEFTHDVCMDDFNGDGLEDLLLMNFDFDPFPGLNLPSLWINHGKRGFANESESRMPESMWRSPLRYEDKHGTPYHSFGSCAPYDLDHDGDQDIIIGGTNDPKNKESDIHANGPWVLVNDGDGYFTLAPEGTFPRSKGIPGEKHGVAYDERLYRADLNGDGTPEIVVSRLAPTRGGRELVTAFTPKKAGKPGRFLRWKNVAKWLPACARDGQTHCGFHPIHLVLRDMNGDGAAELFLGGGEFDRLYLNNGDGRLQNDITHLLAPIYGNPKGQTARLAAGTPADLDGDGYADFFALIFANETKGDSRCKGFDDRCFRPAVMWNRTGSR